jgi:hypothetical protein
MRRAMWRVEVAMRSSEVGRTEREVTRPNCPVQSDFFSLNSALLPTAANETSDAIQY